MSASAIDVRMKDYDGPYNFVETADSWFDPYLKVNGVTISPIVDNNTDLVVSMCDGPQAWQLLKEYTPWKDVNRFGFYTDLGVGSNQELIFEGIRNEGYVTTTSLTGGTIVGFWLHNDVNGDSVFNGDDSYLFSERSLTAGSGANEHQWFRVYDVSAYKGTGATYGFYCATESFTCTGDFDYLLYIDDDHTSSNFDHNDLILGITCEASLPDDCGNIQPGVPPNYFGVDTSYFLGVPALPLPPPDSGGVYIWLDTTTWLWTIASHIYSKGNSLEQFHGNVVALLDEPPQLGVNVFIDNFELWYDTVSNRCLQQNDRWGWSLWDSTLGLYEIWWDVTTKEYKFGAGDLNDFLTIRLTGTAIDFNIWSSGHEDPFNADEIYLGAGMITLADIPGFHDYGGFDVIDEYQAAVGSDPTSDPNTSVFSRHCGIGYSYNSLGLIDSSDSYVCDSDYGLNYAGPWVYQADGIQFSTSGIQNQCVNNNPPVCNLPDDATYFVCGDSTFSFPISADDPDENLIECRMVSGDGTFDSNTWSFTADGPGVYTASFECEDFCGAICSGTVNITVQYNSAPVIDCPANITIACDESADPANTGTATATDDHDPSPDITFTDNETAGSCSQEKTITRTWTATDDCGATAQCQQTITVIDNVAPVISCPANITIECDESTDPSNTGTATATDNCDTAPVITYADVVNSDTITRTWTATDACGNSATCQQVITIDDTTAPVITCPANITVACDESTDPANTGTATATDNCDSSPVITYADSETAGSCPQEKTITRTWTATDENSNSSTCQQIITVIDNVAPVISCPSNLTIECDESTDPSNTGTATATDNCDSAPIITYSDSRSGGVITRTWTATDACGNSATCQQVITIDDTTAPVITCPANITVACDESTNPANTGTATATDNCDPNPVITYTDSETAGSCLQEKTITRTWTATDDNNNSSQCQQTITVIDNVAPVISCPANLTIECDESTDPSNTGTATATDNCDSAPIMTYSDSRSGGVITRTWTATDACGNSATCQQVITIDDTTAPEISCPANITVACDESTDPANTGTATATDNCDSSPVITYADSETAGSCPQEKAITRTWTATDENNNSSQCQQTITVIDNVAPVISCPANLTIECDESTDPSNTGTATATDNCDSAPIMTYSDSRSGGVITRTWTATDACGNSATCQQVITIDDTTAPVITCPGNIMIECDESTDPANTGSATATDNCDSSPVITYADSETAGSCPQEKTITRTWTATDENSNSSTCQQTITVIDNVAPVISCPANLTIECDESTDPSNTGTATATDNCDSSPTIAYADVINSDTITRTWTATDACGNSATCQQVITIDDTTAPEISCPANITVACDESTNPANTGTATATDNCDSSPVITYADSETAGSCPQEKTITRTWTATDENSNSSTCQQIITVIDNIAPVISCPANLTIECDESTDPSNTGTATATDNCDSTPIITYSDSRSGGVITRTWTATDACGNSATCQQVITIDDTTTPVISCPGNITIECDESTDPANTGSATATDNCDSSPVITYADSETAGSCPQEKTITRTWTATDENNNSSQCQQIITVSDNTSPTISCPDDYIIECYGSSDPSITGYATAADNCDTAPTVTYSDAVVGDIITRTWTATDACGNNSQCIQHITFAENNPPIATCPGDAEIFVCELDEICLPGFSCSDPDDNLASCEAIGGTLNAGMICFTPVPGVNQLTLIATDDCGLADSCVTNITVTVNTPPVAGCPDDQEISVCSLEEICISGFSCSDVDDNLATCSVNKGTLNGNTVCFVPTAGNNTIRLIATDSCGAADTSSVTINVTLNNPPEVTCPGLTTVKLTEFPAEVCVSGFAFSDPDGNLAGYEVEGGVLSGNEVCFTASDEGIYAITLTATDDCGAEAYCVTDVFVKRLTVCPIVKIEKTHNTHQGQYENVSITVENSSYPIGGFDFLIAYDNSALTAAGAYAGQWLEDCDWEYFTYRFGSNGNCGDACPSGLLRIIAMAESNDGGNHPDCYGPPDADVYELARIQFLVTNDLNMNCQYVPIYFFWDNCGDNTFSSQEGDYLYIDNRIYNFEGGLIWDEEDETNYPESSRIPFVGAPDNCLNPDPEKPSAIRCIEFVYGGIDIICRDSIDAPGDVNLNGIPNEIGDAIVFTNYFIFSLSAFTINVDGQSAATDVNYDGAMLTVADLVYLIRTIVGDNSPVPKIAPDINAEFVSSGSVITVNRDLGAVHLVLEGRAEIQPGHDAAHMDIISSYDGINTNVLIYSFEKGFTCSGEILQTEAGIVSAEAADYHGNQYAVKIIPNNFALTCYPNPFNPITMIELNLPSSSEWKIEVYNVTGQRVANFEGSSEAGKVRVEWDASDFASGIYLYKAEAGNYRMTRKMALIK